MSMSRESSGEEAATSPSPRLTSIEAPIDVMHLAALLDRFISANSPDEGRQLVEQHAELLSDDASWFLGRALDDARSNGNAEAVFVILERRDILQRCREIGTAATFKELCG